MKLSRYLLHIPKPQTPNPKHLIKVLVGIVLVIGTLGMFMVLTTQESEAGWYNDDWAFRKKITVTNNTSAENNVYVTLSSYSTSDTTRYQGDCGDIRFTKTNGQLMKYYVLSGCGGASTTLHIQFDTLAVGAQDIYLYYGNPSVTNGFEGADFSTAATNASVGSPASEQQSTGPVAAWSFNEGTGTTVQDSTSGNNDGTISGNTVWAPPSECIFGSCLKFDGTSGMVTITDPSNGALDPTTSLTVSAWIKPTLDGGEGTFGRILYGIGDTDIYVSGFSGNTMGLCAKTQSVNDTCTATTVITLNSWNHIAVVYTDNNSRNYYVNGNLVASNDSNNPLNNLASSKYIGNLSADNRTFNGYIDEMRVYGYGRTSDQIKADFTARGSVQGVSAQIGNNGTEDQLSNGLLGYWNFNENAGTSASDTSGNSKTMTLSGANWTVGKFWTAWDGNGARYVYRTDDNDFDISGSSTFTVSGWFKSDSAANPGSDEHLFAKRAAGGIGYEVNITTSGYVTFGIDDDAGSFPKDSTTGSSDVYDAQWHFWTAAMDGSKNIRLYVDGALVAEDSTIASTGSMGNAADVNIGDGNASNSFAGQIDDVHYYTRALTPSEVRALYNWAPGPIGYWKMDENTGTSTTADISGNGNSITLNNITNANWVPGKFGSALNFDGNKWGGVTAGIFDNLTALTWEAWVYHTVTGVTDTFLAKDSSKKDFSINSSNQLTMTITTSGTAATSTSSDTLSANTWYHLTASYDDSDGVRKIKLYINGKEVTYGTQTAATGTVSTDTGASFWIATNQSGSQEYAGYIDDVKVYNYMRTSGKIIEDMNAGHPLGGSPVGSQVGYWKFDEGTLNSCSGGSNDFCDESINVNDLALGQSTAGYTQSGKYGLAFDGGVNYWASRADDDDFDFAASDDFSISLWFRSDAVGNPSAAEYVLTKATVTNTGTAGYALYANTSGNIVFGIKDDAVWGASSPNTPSPDDTVSNSTDIYDATWHHIVATKTGTTRIDLYIDGRLVSSDTALAAAATLANSIALYIDDDDGDTGNSFAGDIDELKIYRAALTQDEVLTEYNQGKATVLGAVSTESDGDSPSWGQDRVYCIPGDPTSCSAPVGEWKFDEKTGATANDTSGNGNTCTLSSMPSSPWVTGKIGGALDFQQSDDEVDCGSGTTLDDLSALTVSAWIKPRTNNLYQQIVTKSSDAQPTNGWLFESDMGSNTLEFWVDRNTTAMRRIASNVITENAWQHVAATWDGSLSASNIHLYVNGVETAYSSTIDGSGAHDSDAAASLTIGIANDLFDDFDGYIDQVHIYNYVRTPAQIAWEYNRSEPVAWYKFDECQGGATSDWSENANGGFNGNNGTVYSLATGANTSVGTCSSGNGNEMWDNGTTGKINASLEFDDTNDYVQVSDATALDLTSGLSISAWVNTDANEADNVIVSKGASYEVGINADGDIYWEGASSQDDASAVVLSGTWHHIVVTNDDTTLTYYVDGVKTGTDSSGVAADNSTVLRIGSDGTNYFDGQIDDVRIFNNVLTASQVKTVYNNGAVSFK